MTRNQIDYLNLVEKQRSARENEQLTRERDAWNKALGFQTLGETQRHNYATEQVATQQIQELSRHNQETEFLSLGQLSEAQRHNSAQEAIATGELQEKARHNVVSEEYSRGQLAVAQRDAATREREATTHEFSAWTQRNTLSESIRHNQAVELETHRNNVALIDETHRANVSRESENRRHNLASESISRSQIGLGYAQLEQQQWYQRQDVNLRALAQSETARANMAREVEAQRANMTRERETERHNVALEEQNVTKMLNELGIQQDRISEEYRHNVAMEANASRLAGYTGLSTWSGVINDSAQTVIGRQGLLGIFSR